MGWRHELGCVSIQVLVNTMELGEVHKRVSMDKEGDSEQNLEHSVLREQGSRKTSKGNQGGVIDKIGRNLFLILLQYKGFTMLC